MIYINTTNINVLTLLLQGDFSLDDFSLYLNLEKKSIYKNINSINSFLKDENLPSITLNNNLYSLKLTKEQWNSLFSRNDFITNDEIIDYLYIKFIHNGFINLEHEKTILNISRSSIIRYFNDIKDILKNNHSEYIYIPGKGLKITYISEQDKNLFCKKLIKYFIKSDFSLNHSIFVTELLQNYNIQKLLDDLYRLFKSISMPITHFVISFLCSLIVCVKVFNGFNFKGDYNYDDYLEIKESIKIYLKEWNSDYQNQIFYFIIRLKNNHVNFEPIILDKAYQIINELKQQLDLQTLEKSLEDILLKKICFSIFKYENHIFKIKNLHINDEERKIFDILDKILNKLEFDLFFCDKVSIIYILKKVIIEHNQHKIKNVLLLFNEIIILDDGYLKENLNNISNKFNFHIEPSFFYKLNPKNYNNKYDLILSDEHNLSSTIGVLNNFSYVQILETINNIIFENSLNSIINK
ncbi:hypothetical protein H5J22_10285 [Cetobacterium sp. 8H]|uniref:hypothetical protein n=1 Tax=Cetobacterium sp. 8H TaxID=2759681 RepID=UPI00163BB02C|nr:hypothetical protein [Cetobacterium sp. 8H]MBC2851782.1 hypothetical protein [Cetobacterium sp. 8H]